MRSAAARLLLVAALLSFILNAFTFTPFSANVLGADVTFDGLGGLLFPGFGVWLEPIGIVIFAIGAEVLFRIARGLEAARTAKGGEHAADLA